MLTLPGLSCPQSPSLYIFNIHCIGVAYQSGSVELVKIRLSTWSTAEEHYHSSVTSEENGCRVTISITGGSITIGYERGHPQKAQSLINL